MTKQTDSKHIKIKKYANRRLYNTATSRYVTLDDLAILIQENNHFTVFDAKSGDDLTRTVLTQIIVEKESKGRKLLPESFLRQLIGCYDHGVEQLVPGYLELCMNRLSQEQDCVSQQYDQALPSSARATIQDFTHKNWVIFEHALSSFFSTLKAKIKPVEAEPAADTDLGTQSEQPAGQIQFHQGTAPADPAPLQQDIRRLQQQLHTLQSAIDTLVEIQSSVQPVHD